METEATYDVLYDICAELWTLDLGGKTPQEIAEDCDMQFNQLRAPIYKEDQSIVNEALSRFKHLTFNNNEFYLENDDDLKIDYTLMRGLLKSAIRSIMTNPLAIKEDK